MTNIPKRSSLVAQTVEILARGIRSGEWSEYLPAEREICRLLQVSRPTVRAALLILQREGLLRTTRGQRRRIVASRKQLSRPDRPRVIGVLYPERTNSWISLGELKTRFYAAGFDVHVHGNLRLGGVGLEKRLETLVQNTPAACWILSRCPENVQNWFANGKIPAFVLGSCHVGVDLSSLDLHHRASCRHAVQVLLRQGHRHILFFGIDRQYAGDFLGEKGFQEAFERSEHSQALSSIVYHDGTVDGIRQALEAQLQLPQQPTAVIVRQPSSALTVFSHLVTSGRRIPEDISFISIHEDKAFAHIVPDIACYTVNWDNYLAQVVRIVCKLAEGNSSKLRESLIVPKFRKGKTVAPPNSKMVR